MKKILFISLAVVLALSVSLIGCEGEEGEDNEIIFAVCGPQDYIQGQHQKLGAELAAAEINAAGGIDVGGTAYDVVIDFKDTQELDPPSPTYPAQQVENAITVDGASFILGGFRTESTIGMIDAAMEQDTIMFISGAATASLCRQVNDDYETYKYLFRGTPYNDVFLFNNTMLILAQLGMQIQGTLAYMGANITTPRVGIIAEDLTWTSAIVAGIESFVAGFNWTPAPTQLVEQDADDLSTEFGNLGDCHVIYLALSGPVGVTYGTQHKTLAIPSMTTGINVEGQDPGYWDATSGGAAYECSLVTYVDGVDNTAKTADFISAFQDEADGVTPIYTAATYDCIYTLKAAIEDVGGFDASHTDDIITYLEGHNYVGSSFNNAYYPAGYPEPLNHHDLIYGPGFATGIGSQWMDEAMVGIWPNTAFGDLYNAVDLFSNNWTGFTYPGITDITLDPAAVAEWVTWS